MPYLENRGLRFYYEVAGSPAAPPLLIIAGLTDYMAKSQWQVADLARDYHVITFDNRGAGRTSVPPPSYTTADMADDAEAILTELDMRSAHVFGFSLGGMIALNLAIRHPQRVNRLVLGCTTAGGHLLVRPSEQALGAMFSLATSGDKRRDFLDGVRFSLGPRTMETRPELVETLAEIAIDNPQTAEGRAGQIQAVLTHDVADRLPEITGPVLVMHGEQDQIIPLENGRLLAQHLPNAHFIGYSDAGHLFFIEHAERVNRDIRAFLSDNPRD